MKNNLNKKKDQLINGAFSPSNWSFDRKAKTTMLTSAGMVLGTILLVNIIGGKMKNH
jgi:hypothetical protein